MEGSLVGLQVIIGDKGVPAEDALVPGPGQQGIGQEQPLELRALKAGPHLALSSAALRPVTPQQPVHPPFLLLAAPCQPLQQNQTKLRTLAPASFHTQPRLFCREMGIVT